MTQKEMLEDEFEKKLAEVKAKCDEGRKQLDEWEFFDRRVPPPIFRQVFNKYWEYGIHSIDVMNCDIYDGTVYLQFMIKFEDDDTKYTYVDLAKE